MSEETDRLVDELEKAGLVRDALKAIEDRIRRDPKFAVELHREAIAEIDRLSRELSSVKSRANMV